MDLAAGSWFNDGSEAVVSACVVWVADGEVCELREIVVVVVVVVGGGRWNGERPRGGQRNTFRRPLILRDWSRWWPSIMMGTDIGGHLASALAVRPWMSGRKPRLSAILIVESAGEEACMCEGDEVGRGGIGDSSSQGCALLCTTSWERRRAVGAVGGMRETGMSRPRCHKPVRRSDCHVR